MVLISFSLVMFYLAQCHWIKLEYWFIVVWPTGTKTGFPFHTSSSLTARRHYKKSYKKTEEEIEKWGVSKKLWYDAITEQKFNMAHVLLYFVTLATAFFHLPLGMLFFVNYLLLALRTFNALSLANGLHRLTSILWFWCTEC